MTIDEFVKAVKELPGDVKLVVSTGVGLVTDVEELAFEDERLIIYPKED